MQYLLTEDEFRNLTAKAKRGEEAPSDEDLQKFCTLVADNMPADPTGPESKPWGCVLTERREHYCDNCPAKQLCPNQDKHWSQ